MTEKCPACGQRIELHRTPDGGYYWPNHSKKFTRRPGKQFMCVMALAPYREPEKVDGNAVFGMIAKNNETELDRHRRAR